MRWTTSAVIAPLGFLGRRALMLQMSVQLLHVRMEELAVIYIWITM